MILFDGQLMPDKQAEEIIDRLPGFCCQTIENRQELAQTVIEACDILSGKIASGCYDTLLTPLLARGLFTRAQLAEAISFFQREHLEYKYHTELGVLSEHTGPLPAYGTLNAITRRYVPIGILFHIAAGNAEGLPFYSVIEGMLAGNVNILKLPSADDGLSVLLLQELIQIKPVLAPYVTVFDIPSANVRLLKKLGSIADAIVVWGGDEAITAARSLADPATQIISWGHKLSFAYITPDAPSGGLRKLAAHICATNQLLCSSCQGIFVDTGDMAVIRTIGQTFLTHLEEESKNYPPLSIGIRGKNSIALYNEELEAAETHRQVLRGKGVSVLLAPDCRLELSYLFRSCWIKPLPRTAIISALKPYRGYLQTVGLICAENDWNTLSERLIRAGAVRIRHAGNMSEAAPGEAHDGEYSLRRYTRIAELEES